LCSRDFDKCFKVILVNTLIARDKDLRTFPCDDYFLWLDMHPVGHVRFQVVQHEKMWQTVGDPVVEVLNMFLVIPPSRRFTICGSFRLREV